MNPVAERTTAKNDFFDFTRALFDLKKVFGKPEALSDLRVIEFGTLFLEKMQAFRRKENPAFPYTAADLGLPCTRIGRVLAGQGVSCAGFVPRAPDPARPSRPIRSGRLPAAAQSAPDYLTPTPVIEPAGLDEARGPLLAAGAAGRAGHDRRGPRLLAPRRRQGRARGRHRAGRDRAPGQGP